MRENAKPNKSKSIFFDGYPPLLQFVVSHSLGVTPAEAPAASIRGEPPFGGDPPDSRWWVTP